MDLETTIIRQSFKVQQHKFYFKNCYSVVITYRNRSFFSCLAVTGLLKKFVRISSKADLGKQRTIRQWRTKTIFTSECVCFHLLTRGLPSGWLFLNRILSIRAPVFWMRSFISTFSFKRKIEISILVQCYFCFFFVCLFVSFFLSYFHNAFYKYKKMMTSKLNIPHYCSF